MYVHASDPPTTTCDSSPRELNPICTVQKLLHENEACLPGDRGGGGRLLLRGRVSRQVGPRSRINRCKRNKENKASSTLVAGE